MGDAPGRASRRHRPDPWPARRAALSASGITYHGYRVGAVLANALPRPVAVPVARAGGVLAWGLARRRRAVVRRNLRRVSGGRWRGLRLELAVVATFASYGRYWLELFRAPNELARGLEGRLEVRGWEHLEQALAAGRGCVVALPHVGGFDVAGAWLAARGLAPLVVVEPVTPPQLFEWFARLRRRLGMEVVPLGSGAAAAVAGALRARRVVGLLCDRDLAGDGPEVVLFGERTTLPGGPALLALRTGAPLVPAAVYFSSRGRHRARVLPPVQVERTGRLRDDVSRITQSLAHALEDLIAAAPTQWHVMQPNWPSDRALVEGRRARR